MLGSRNEKRKKYNPLHDESLSPVQSTQANLNIKEIYDGIIITNDDRYIKVMEIRPSQFSLKTLDDKFITMDAFKAVLRVIPYNFQITTMAFPSDITQQLEIIDANLAKETVPSVIELDKEYKNKLIESSRNSVYRRFFISFEYERTLRRVTIQEIVHELNAIANRISTILKTCENDIVRNYKQNPNWQTAEILYSILNRRKAGKKNFEMHLQQVINRYYDHYGDPNFHVPPTDIVAPRQMTFNDSRYIVINNEYYTFAFIRKDGYAEEVYPGWLEPFINSYEGVDVNIFAEKIPSEDVISSIRRNYAMNQGNMLSKTDESENYQSSQSAAAASAYFLDAFKKNDDFFYASVMITISGRTPQIVEMKLDELKRTALQQGIKLGEYTHEEEQAFQMSLPLVQRDKRLWNKAKRNMTSDGLASFYPFTSGEFNDPNGIYLGNDGVTGTQIIIDPFNRDMFTNSNIICWGETGSGKTYTMFMNAIRFRLIRVSCWLILPEKEDEGRRMAAALGAQFVQLADGSPTCINIMQIYPQDETSNQYIDGMHERQSYLSEKIATLKVFFSMVIDKLDEEQKQLLDNALMETYAEKGITMDNNSIYADESHTTLKEMPIISDLQKVLMRNPKTERMGNILRQFTTGSSKNFNGQTNVDLSTGFTVFGLEHMQKSSLALGLFIALDYVWSRIKEDRVTKNMIFTDEFWRLAFNDVAADYFVDIAKTVRSYNSGMYLASQSISDVMNMGTHGVDILGQCQIKIIMKQESNEIAAVKDILHLNESQIRQIATAQRGEGLFIANNIILKIQFDASKLENDLITTDSKQLLKIAKRRQEEEQLRLENERKMKEKEEVFIENLDFDDTKIEVIEPEIPEISVQEEPEIKRNDDELLQKIDEKSMEETIVEDLDFEESDESDENFIENMEFEPTEFDDIDKKDDTIFVENIEFEDTEGEENSDRSV